MAALLKVSTDPLLVVSLPEYLGRNDKIEAEYKWVRISDSWW